MQRRAEIALSLFVLGMALPLAAQDVPNTGPNQFEIGGFGGFSYGVDHSRGLQQAPTAGAAEDQRRKDKRWPHFPPGCSRRAGGKRPWTFRWPTGDLWSSGGPAEEKARNTAFPNAAMLSQTIIIFHGGVMPNWPRPPVQERSVGTSEDPTSWEANSALRRADYACRFQRHRQEF